MSSVPLVPHAIQQALNELELACVALANRGIGGAAEARLIRARQSLAEAINQEIGRSFEAGIDSVTR